MGSTKRSKLPPTKTELANFKVLEEEGLSPNAIGKVAGRDPKTVRKWLQSDVYQNDPNVRELVEKIREKESEDLVLLGAKARERLHELIPKETKLIPLVALMDRSFQQVRLLQGKSNVNLDLLQKHYAINAKAAPVTVVDLQRHLRDVPTWDSGENLEEPG